MTRPEAPRAAPFFLLRTPLLPHSTLTDWAAGLCAPGTPDAELDAALETDGRVLRARLRQLLDGDPAIEEAVHVASPDLTAALVAWRREPEGERGRRAERALIRYLARMSARPTPYGLFAGFGTGLVDRRTRLCVAPRPTLRRHVRLDMEYLCEVVASLDRSPENRCRLRYRASSSLYRAAGRLRYVEYTVEKGARRHRLVAAEASDYLERVLAAAATPRRLAELASVLISDEVTEDECMEFLHELVDAQLLVSELEPGTTGPEAAPPLLDTLARAGTEAAGLAEAQSRVEALRREPLGAPAAAYDQIASALEPLGVPAVPGRLLQVDLVRPAAGSTLGRDVVAAVQQAVRVLHRVAPDRPDSALKTFARAFEARYEGREVPLSEALDEESGIGFDRSEAPSAEASPLLAEVPLPAGGKRSARWDPVQALLLEKLAGGEHEVSLAEAELEAAGIANPLPLPASFAVMGSVLAPAAEDVDAGRFRVQVMGLVGPSGARLLGRFCHADPELAELVRGLLRAEEEREPDRVFAEIVHLPEGRAGNVTARPLLRGYEIPFLGRSAAPPERQIPLDDLLVSVRDGRIVLRSRRLDREVVPRLSSAHNFALGISPYRFLCALQHQDVAAVGGFTWGPLESAPFLPRVVTGKAVLEPARWRVDAPAAAELERDGYRGWRRLRERLALPRQLQLREGDNRLPLDLDNPLLLDAALSSLVRQRGGVLSEALPGPDELCAEGPEGRFTHEFILPFTVPRPAETGRAGGAPLAKSKQMANGRPGDLAKSKQMAQPADLERDLLPGSEWLYARIECGTAGADQVIQALAPLAREAVAGGAACQWFFIRYADPGWHLRLRLRGHPGRLLGELLPALHQAVRPLQADGLVAGLRLDTYRREVERYGGPDAVEAVERIFWADSDCVAALLAELDGDGGLDARWRLGLLGSDLLLRDLGYQGEARLRVVRAMRDGLRREFSAPPATLKAIAHAFTRERPALLQLLRGDPARDDLAPAVAHLERRSRLWGAPLAELRRLEGDGRLEGGLDRVAASLVHMHLNRILRSAHRAQELVIYDLWERCLLVPAG